MPTGPAPRSNRLRFEIDALATCSLIVLEFCVGIVMKSAAAELMLPAPKMFNGTQPLLVSEHTRLPLASVVVRSACNTRLRDTLPLCVSVERVRE